METVCARAEEWKLDRELVGYALAFDDHSYPNQHSFHLLDLYNRYLGGVLLEGGSDTTSSFLQSLILALVTHPEVQKKAQEEIDRVVGNDRAPVLEDIEHLPYCQAIILEVRSTACCERDGDSR